jgi:hypothetical protein
MFARNIRQARSILYIDQTLFAEKTLLRYFNRNITYNKQCNIVCGNLILSNKLVKVRFQDG